MTGVKRPWLPGSRRVWRTVIGATALLVGGFALTPAALGAATPGGCPAAEVVAAPPAPGLSCAAEQPRFTSDDRTGIDGAGRRGALVGGGVALGTALGTLVTVRLLRRVRTR